MKKLLAIKSAPFVIYSLSLVYALSLIYTLSLVGKMSFDHFQKDEVITSSISSGGLKYQKGNLSNSNLKTKEEKTMFIKAINEKK